MLKGNIHPLRSLRVVSFSEEVSQISYVATTRRWLRLFHGKNSHTCRFTKVSNRDIEKYLSSQPKKSNNDILGMDDALLKESATYISESIAHVINKSLKLGVFEQDRKNARVSPI